MILMIEWLRVRLLLFGQMNVIAFQAVIYTGTIVAI